MIGKSLEFSTTAAVPSTLNITYLDVTDPAIKSITNKDILLLSATSPASDNTTASIVLDGEGTTNLTVQMPNTALAYVVTWDGQPCTGGDCTFTQDAGELNFTLTLGSAHILDVRGAQYLPPDPTTLQNTTGNFWVNHTWQPGSGNVSDSYNVSVNQTWHNTTTNAYWNNTPLSPHGWSNITVYAWNNTAGGNLSAGNVSQDTQVPNNAITITNTSGWSGNEGANVYVDYDATDADSDTPTFSCNRTDLFMDFDTANGTGNWTAVSGTYYVDFGVSDGYGSTSNYTMTITVSGAPLTYNCTCGDICVNTNGWWYHNNTFNASAVPIQDAVNNATAGETICVKDGTYYENVNVATRLTIRSENGSSATTVNASDSSDHVFEVTVNYVNISGFTVENATGTSKAGIFLTGANYCNISYNDAIANWHGIYLYNSCGHNNVTNNNASFSIQIGVLLHWVCSNNNVIDNVASSNNFHGFRIKEFGNYNLIKNNTANNNIENGFYLFDSCNYNTIIDNTMNFNADGIRVAKSCHDVNISNNTLANNTKGFHIIASHNNSITCNWVHNSTGHGFYLTNVSPAVIGGLDSVDNNISYNNIITNGNYNGTSGGWEGQFNTTQSSDVEAKHNYWGTTVSSEIAASIEENTGNVTYTQFLSWYSPCAPGYREPVLYIPPDPVNIANTTGNFWINHTWDAGTGNVTDSYNILVNSVWHNVSPAYYNDTYTAHAWQNITVFAYNSSDSGTLSAGSISQNTQIPNNPITITNTSDWSGDPGNNVYVDYDATDLDSDTPTFSCNRTDLFTDFSTSTGKGNWTAAAGTYYVDFGVSDGWGSISNYTMTITVSAATFNCTCGDICVNTSGWWYNNSAFNASAVPIQDAVNNATAGETICVKDGTYYENVDVATRVTIRSENGSSVTTVNAPNLNDHVFEVTVNYVNISGFKVENATGGVRAGILLQGASYCNISDNTASGNFFGIHLLSGSNNNDLTSNTANTNTQYGIYLSASHNNDLTSNTANTNTVYGIVMDSSKNNTLSGCSAIGNSGGIVVMYSSNNNTISGCYALHSTYHGIYMISSSNNTISGSTPKWNHQHGIYMTGSTNNNLTSNEVDANQQYGIYLSGSTNNNLTSNRIHLNWQYGIYLSGSNNNTIYNNRFQNYPNNAWDNGYNTWNTTPTPGQNIYGGSWLGGNYWSDYAGVDLSGDGLGDTLIPYNSSGNIVNGGDRHPLVQAAASYIPPDPITLQNTTGNFWVNHTWSAGSGNVTDSYNVSVNGTWHNGTTNPFWNNTPLSPHAWSNITVYAWNDTGGLSAGSISQDTQIPNNDPGAGSPSPHNGATGVSTSPTLQVTVTDADTDTMSVRFYEQGGSQIGSTQTGIASGGTASVIWGGRSTSTTYHWYVVTNDTYNETTTAIWHFTTQSGGPSHQVTIEDCSNRQTTEGGEIYNDFNYTNDDSDIPVFTTNATVGTLNSSTGVYNWTTGVGDAGVYVWWFRVDNAYGNHDDCTVTFTVTSSDVQPPTNLQNTTGNFWVRHSWTPGANTDSYNVSVNSAWHNTTINAFWDNAGMSAHAWSNISIAGYNSTTGNLSSFIGEDTQVPNNPITIINTSDWNGDTGENVYVDYDSTDADSDTPTYSCSRTDLFTDFSTVTGTGNWTPAINGTYSVDFGVSDGWGSTSNYTMTIRVGVSGGITTETKIPIALFIALAILMFFSTGYIFYAKSHISRIFTTLIATWMAFMLSQMIVSGNVVQMVSALNSADVWTHDTVAIQIPALSYLLLFIGVILSIFLVKFVVVFGLAVIKEAQREEM